MALLMNKIVVLATFSAISPCADCFCQMSEDWYYMVAKFKWSLLVAS
jgi:hypothetical protein